jgi:hypothetical protein
MSERARSASSVPVAQVSAARTLSKSVSTQSRQAASSGPRIPAPARVTRSAYHQP